MSKNKLVMLSLAVASLSFMPVVNAGVIVQLGDVDFQSLQNVQLQATPACTGLGGGEDCFNAKSAGEPPPFDGLKGSDTGPTTFSESFAFSYGAVSGPIASASIVLGLFEAESSRTGSQVAFFRLNGEDLTALLDAALEATPTGGLSEVHYTVQLPPSVFDALATGTATFELQLRNGANPSGAADCCNSAGLDFATLTINIPEPSTLALLGLGLAGLAASRRRKQ